MSYWISYCLGEDWLWNVLQVAHRPVVIVHRAGAV